ncbi:MAG: hypothetical protein AAF702_44605 [Chloroflexota bacterium]
MKHRNRPQNLPILFRAVQMFVKFRAVIIDRAQIETIVLIDSRTNYLEIIGEPLAIQKSRSGEWILAEVDEREGPALAS